VAPVTTARGDRGRYRELLVRPVGPILDDPFAQAAPPASLSGMAPGVRLSDAGILGSGTDIGRDRDGDGAVRHVATQQATEQGS